MKHFTKKMIKNISLAGFAVFGVLNMSYGQTFEWAAPIQSASNIFGTSVAADIDGNVYSTGYFFGTAEFDHGAGSTLLTSAGQQDIYVCKYDSDGNLLWARSFGSTLRDRADGLTIDSDNNVYITGYFEATVDFDPGPGVMNLTSQGLNAYILKLDTNGDFVWVKNIDGPLNSQGVSLHTDLVDNIYATGWVRGTQEFDAVQGFNVTSLGERDIWIAKINTAGDYEWVRSHNGVLDGFGADIIADKTGNVYVSGFFNGSFEFNSVGMDSPLTSLGGRDAFLSKFTSTGDFEWVSHIGSAAEVRGEGLGIDDNLNVYLGGWFNTDVTIDIGGADALHTSNGGNDIMVMKFDGLGALQWSRSFGGTGSDQALCLKANNLGDVYITGGFQNTVDFDPSVGTSELAAVAASDQFIQVLSTDGDALMFLNQSSSTGVIVAERIFVDYIWNVYTTGRLTGTATFDVGGVNEVITSLGGTDAYTEKYNGNCMPPDVPTLVEQTNDVCPGSTVIIDLTAGDLNDATDWVWYDDVFFTNQVGTGTQLSIVLTDTTTLRVRGEGACIASTNSITINVADNEAPEVIAADFTIATDAGVCEATGVDLGETITDNCALDQILNDAPTTFPIGQTIVTWTVTDLAGNETIHEQLVTVEDQEAPVADIASLDDIVELCEVTMLTAPTATDNCDGSIAGTHDATLPIIVTSTITWTYEDANGNSSTQQQEVIIEGVDVSTTVDGTTLTANNSNLGVFYRWVDCNNNFAPIVNATNQVFTPEENGSYAVVIVEDGCQDTSACIDVTTVGLDDLNQQVVLVYPNPSKGNFEIALLTNEAFVYSVTDNSGRIVLAGTFNQQLNTIDLTQQENGVYFLHLNGFVRKLVKN